MWRFVWAEGWTHRKKKKSPGRGAESTGKSSKQFCLDYKKKKGGGGKKILTVGFATEVGGKHRGKREGKRVFAEIDKRGKPHSKSFRDGEKGAR